MPRGPQAEEGGGLKIMPMSTLSLAMADDTPEAHRTIVCRPRSQDVIVYDLSGCQDLNTAPETISRGGLLHTLAAIRTGCRFLLYTPFGLLLDGAAVYKGEAVVLSCLASSRTTTPSIQLSQARCEPSKVYAAS